MYDLKQKKHLHIFALSASYQMLNPLIQRLFLNPPILKKMKKIFGEVLSNFENIMENRAFALKEQILHFL